jgi:hypothetical protein
VEGPDGGISEAGEGERVSGDTKRQVVLLILMGVFFYFYNVYCHSGDGVVRLTV